MSARETLLKSLLPGKNAVKKCCPQDGILKGPGRAELHLSRDTFYSRFPVLMLPPAHPKSSSWGPGGPAGVMQAATGKDCLREWVTPIKSEKMLELNFFMAQREAVVTLIGLRNISYAEEKVEDTSQEAEKDETMQKLI